MQILKQPGLEPYYNDERIKFEQYRASHYAFITISVLLMAMMGITLFFWDREVQVWVAASVGLGILMVGFWVMIIKSWRAGLFTALREQVNSKAVTRRKMLRRLAVSTLFFGVWMGVFDYYVMSEHPSVGRAVLMGLVDALFWGAGMYWLQMRRLKKDEEIL